MEKPHAGMADRHRPTDGGRSARPVGLYSTGADFIKMLFPVCYPDGSPIIGISANAGVVAQGLTAFPTRGSWVQWTACSNPGAFFRLTKNKQPVSDWLPIIYYANEQAIAANVAQFRPLPPILCCDFDLLEVYSTGGTTTLNAMIGVGGSAAQ